MEEKKREGKVKGRREVSAKVGGDHEGRGRERERERERWQIGRKGQRQQ